MMTVKIIIHRKVKRGKESDFSKLLRELRRKAMGAKEYISGKTLRLSNDYHNRMVISICHSVGDCKNWEKIQKGKKSKPKLKT